MGISKKEITEFVQKHNKPVAFVILVLALGIFFSLIQLQLGDYINNKGYDLLVKHVGGREDVPHKDVMLILIDEFSMKYGKEIGFGRWPWKRSAYPEILNFINRTDPPKAILFDILFPEPDLSRIDPNLGMDNDTYFAQGIIESGNVIQNVLLRSNSEREKPFILPPDVRKNYVLNVNNSEKIGFSFNISNEYTFPIPCLRSAVECSVKDKDKEKDSDIRDNPIIQESDPSALGMAIASFKPDSDGVYRRGRILFKYIDNFLPSFTLTGIKAHTMSDSIEIVEDNVIKVGKYVIPVDPNGNYLVNYYKKRVPAVSMSAVLDSAILLNRIDNGEEIDEELLINPSEFKDKIVIIGVSAVGGQDLKNTPLSETTPGPEIHTTIISNILQGNQIIYENTYITYLIAFVVILLCVGAVVFIGSNLLKLIIFISVLIVYGVLNLYLFNNYNYLSPVLLLLGTGFFSSAISFIYLSMTEGAEKRKYSKILGNMIDPQIVSEALNDLEALKKGGEKNITAFFSDIASFSTISEKLSSGDLAALLNEYLSAMTDILKSHGGTLDKYIGDAVVGIFGAPMDNEDHAIFAARASLKMDEKLAVLREKWSENNEYCPEAQQMTARIGLNTGMAKVGFMGTENLASYTMMGDTVNLAARLEAAGKDYGVEILVSEMTRNKIKDEMLLRLLDAVRVKGKTEPVHIYELVGLIGGVKPNIVEAINLYEKAFNLYMERAWQEAAKLFKNSAEAKGELDKSTKLLINRCLLYKKQPPPENWDGVFTRTTK